MGLSLAGTLEITSCPSATQAEGAIITVGAKAINTGTAHNNSFVIGITVARSDTGVVLKSVNSGNVDIKAGTSYTFTTTFVMPRSGVNVSYDLQADPAFNY